MAGIKPISKITLRDMIINFDQYYGLPDGLIQLPVPERVKIKGKYYPIPQDYDEFMKSICYGQRLFMVREERNDFGIIVRMIEGYYYTLVTRNKWDEDKALSFGKYVISLQAEIIYPVAMHLVKLVGELVDREQKLLHREPSKMELAAGIEKLNVFAELTSLDFLRDAMKCTVPEVLLTPYSECLVRFMIAKETADYQERYFELMREQSQPKPKYHGQAVL